MKNTFRFSALAVTLVCGLAFGQKDSTGASKLGFSSGGYLYYENYRLWAADYQGEVYKGDWFNSILGGFVLDNVMSERLRTRVSLESQFYRPFPAVANNEESRMTVASTYLNEAKAIYAFGDPAAPPWEVEVGYFLYDYNKDQHNLGEYLFRSNIYPVTLNTNFDLPMDRLLGIRLGNRPFPGFHQDFLLTSEYQYYPKSDFSLSYVADYSLGGVLQIGAGIDLDHYLPVRPSLVTPHSDDNTYIQIPAQTWTDANGVAHTIAAPINIFKSQLNSMANADSISSVDPNTFNRVLDPQIQEKTTYFTYKGIKLMARASFDPKPLLGNPEALGKEDLKLYTEVAVLGVQDYPFLYQNIKQRIPVMAGIDLPCFKLLDVLSFEMEYFANKWPDDYQKSLLDGVPQPGDQNFTFTPGNYAAADWKWSLYLRKQITKGLFISAQAASDHLRLPDFQGFTYETLMKDTGNPFKDGQWWGIMRVTATY